MHTDVRLQIFFFLSSFLFSAFIFCCIFHPRSCFSRCSHINYTKFRHTRIFGTSHYCWLSVRSNNLSYPLWILFQFWVRHQTSLATDRYLIPSLRFFSNTGAVAGTFTIAGLFGVAGIIGVGMMIARRRVSRSYDDDMEYLEKKLDPAVEHSQDQDFVVGDIEDLSDLSHVSNTMEVTVPPAAHLHPQYDVYGQTTNGSDGHEGQDYYPQGAYPPQVYGIAYPSRESYAAADPYGGIDESSGMPNPFDNVATELPAASQHSNQQLRTPSPPLTTYLHRSIDSFYGSSATASHGHAM